MYSPHSLKNIRDVQGVSNEGLQGGTHLDLSRCPLLHKSLQPPP